MDTKYTVVIDGGMGRQICAMPALEKFVEKNPETTIVTHYWTAMFFGNKKLTKHVFDGGTKGLFDRVKDTKILKPEPYHNNDFINDRCSLIDAFNQELNGDKDKMPLPNIHFSRAEIAQASTNRIVSGKKNVVIQPFGSTASVTPTGEIVDNTVRSLNLNNTKHLIDKLFGAGFNVILLDHRDFNLLDKTKYVNTLNMEYRMASALIPAADYFIGVDSAGQHIAAAVGKPGTTFFGASGITNYGYPELFKIITREGYEDKAYMAMRLADFDYQLASVENEDLLNFAKDEFDAHCEWIINDIRQKTA